MDAELIFWIVCVVLMVLGRLALPFVYNAMDKAEVDKMFRRPCKNIDDMEDRWD